MALGLLSFVPKVQADTIPLGSSQINGQRTEQTVSIGPSIQSTPDFGILCEIPKPTETDTPTPTPTPEDTPTPGITPEITPTETPVQVTETPAPTPPGLPITGSSQPSKGLPIGLLVGVGGTLFAAGAKLYSNNKQETPAPVEESQVSE